MMFREKGKSVTVEEVKGGWLLEWDEPDDDTAQVSSWPPLKKAPTRGREIYTTKKALLKRLTEFF